MEAWLKFEELRQRVLRPLAWSGPALHASSWAYHDLSGEFPR